MKKRLFSPLLAAALAAAVALTAAALPAFADGGEETPITIGQSQEQQAECTCTALCTGDSVNADCPVCGAGGADLTACEGTAVARAAALAAPLADGDTVYVGGVALSVSTGSPAYATTDESGNVSTDGATAANYNIKWDGSTLTLRGATIKKELNGYDESLFYITGAAIGVFNQSGDANLTITLEGTNTIEGVSYGIRVYAPSIGSANLTITGSGTLYVNSNQDPIYVISSNGNAALGIKNAKVTATSSFGFGVTVQSGSSETSSASLTVDGGSLTATAQSSGVSGIRLLFGTGGTSDGTPTVTVSNNAIVRANGSAGGITSNSSTGVQYGTGGEETGGIIWNGAEGTVYGEVELQEDLEIGEGESLTIPGGASLNTNGKLTVDGGTLTGNVTGTVNYKVTGVSLDKTNLNLNPGKGGTLIATITPSNATNQNVTWESSDTKVVTVDNGLVTAVAEGSATITVTTEDGSKTATCTVIVTNNGSGPVVPPQPSDPAPSQPEGGGSSSAGAGSSGSAAPRQQSPVVHNVSNSSAYRKGEYEFWMKVRAKIVSAGPGEVIEVNARDNDKMPNSVMQALAAKEDVTLRIRWNGGEEIVIPSAAALQEKMRMFYPLSYLAKFDFAQTPAQKVK